MRKVILAVLAALLLSGTAGAQQFIQFYPPSGTGTGGDIDPGQISSPDSSITVGGAVGAVTLNVTAGVFTTFTTGAGDPPATCTLGASYLETDTFEVYDCTDEDPDTWALRITPALTSTSGFGFVVDEDDMVSDSASKVPTQQSVKAYVGASSGTLDPSTTIFIHEEFLTSLNTDGHIGAAGLYAGEIASGTSAWNIGGVNHPGWWRLTPAAGDNSGNQLSFITGSGGDNFSANTADNWAWDFLFRPNTTIANSAYYIGLLSAANADPGAQADFVGVKYDTDDSDATWIFQICNANAAGCAGSVDDTASKVVASTKTPANDTWQRFRLSRLQSGVGGNPTIYMRINDETAKTFCSSGCDDTLGTLPTNALTPGLAALTRTTSATNTFDIDYISLKFTGMVRYTP